MLAYGGGLARTSAGPSIFDLAGMRLPGQKLAAFKDHDYTAELGYTERLANDGRSLLVDGQLLEACEAAQKVVARAEDGFPWQASVGLATSRSEFLEEGQSATVNGREVNGPCRVVRESTLREVSITALGADEETWVRARAGVTERQESRERPKEATVTEEKKSVATLAELRGAFPGDPQFVLEQLGAGATLEAAQRTFYQARATTLEAEAAAKALEIKAKDEALAAAKTELEALKATKARAGAWSGAATTATLPTDPVQAFPVAVTACARDRGLTRKAATLAVIQEMPELHAAFVAEFNRAHGREV